MGFKMSAILSWLQWVESWHQLNLRNRTQNIRFPDSCQTHKGYHISITYLTFRKPFACCILSSLEKIYWVMVGLDRMELDVQAKSPVWFPSIYVINCLRSLLHGIFQGFISNTLGPENVGIWTFSNTCLWLIFFFRFKWYFIEIGLIYIMSTVVHIQA